MIVKMKYLLIRFFISILSSGVSRTRWIKKFKIFKEDVPKYFGCIEVGSNVFIGARVTILPNIKICDNVIIATGALVTKSIDKSGVWSVQQNG